MKIIDIHSHYDDDKYGDYDLDLLFRDIFNNNVLGIIISSVDIESCKNILNISRKYKNVFVTAGFHPENILPSFDLNAQLDLLSNIIENDKIVGIGEIGLDYYWESNPPKKIQIEWFQAQIDLAIKKNLPIVVHDRDAHSDVVEVIKSNKESVGVIHSCSMSAELVKEVLKQNWYISFSGTVTFKNAKKVIEALKVVPLERILVETDAPYLTPEPFRGKINRSDYIIYSLQKISEIKHIDIETLSEIIINNTKNIFKLKI